MEDEKQVIPDYISLNDTVAQCAMCMVIEGYKNKDVSMIDKAITIVEVFKGVPLLGMERKKFIEKFGD